MKQFRSEQEMARDTSLNERVKNCALYLMRAKGKYRDRLVDISLALMPLRPESFTDEAAPVFQELATLVEKHRTDIQVMFGHFRDPSPAARKKIAELTLELIRLVAIAEEKYGYK